MTTPSSLGNGVVTHAGKRYIRIGFATADQIAQRIGIPRDSVNRARAGIDHVLLEATSDGHWALPLPNLKAAAMKLLEISEAAVEQALSQMLAGGSLLREEIDGEPLILIELTAVALFAVNLIVTFARPPVVVASPLTMMTE